MKKLFTLLTLALMSIGSAWADTESSGNTGESNKPWNGTSCSLNSASIAGKGSVKQGNMPDKGVKLRSTTSLVFKVNEGIKITRFQFWAAGNTATAVNIASATIDGGSDILGGAKTIPGKGAETSLDLDFNNIEATDNITLNFADGSTAQIVGTWKITYVVEQVVVQEITGVTLNGSAISASDLATLKSTKALTINGSSLNGLGALDVTLSSSATTVTRTIDGTSAIYTFTINTTDNYTVTVTNVVKTYTKTGVVLAYKEDDTEADGTNTKAVTMNGITAEMVGDPTKTFQNGSGKVTLGSNVYVPLKLSTGSDVNVTFPAGTVATKVKVYGWSANGNGKLYAMKETSDAGAKSVDVSADVYYATNTANDVYPSVYEYDLDNWASLWFNPGGSPSQPFVVMEFTLENNATATIGSTGWSTFVCGAPLDFTGISGVKAYIVTGHSGNAITTTQMTGTVPANTPLLIEGTTTAIPVAASSSTDVSANLLKAGTGAAVSAESSKTKYVLSAKEGNAVFKKINANAATVPAGKAYLEFDEVISAPELDIVFNGDVTGISATLVNNEKVNSEVYDLQGRKVMNPAKGLYIVNGRKVIIK